MSFKTCFDQQPARSSGYGPLFYELDRLGCLWGPEGDRQIDRQYESYMLIINTSQYSIYINMDSNK